MLWRGLCLVFLRLQVVGRRGVTCGDAFLLTVQRAGGRALWPAY